MVLIVTGHFCTAVQSTILKTEPKGLSSRPLNHYSTWRCIIRPTSSEPSPIGTPLYDMSRLEAVQILPSYVTFPLVLFTRGMFCLLLRLKGASRIGRLPSRPATITSNSMVTLTLLAHGHLPGDFLPKPVFKQSV